MQEVLASTALYYKACTNHFPLLLCTTKLARSTSQYFFVLQSLHTARRTTTLYNKILTGHVPVLLCTTRLAQSTSQYYFVLETLHKARPRTTLCYACPRFAQSTSQDYFVLKSLQMSTEHDNNHAAITLRSATKVSTRAKTYAQPLIAEHRGGTDCPSSRSDPQPPHTRAAHHRRLHPLHTEKHEVSCSGFLPNTSPMQHPCSHTRMHFAAPCYKRACIYAHGNKT